MPVVRLRSPQAVRRFDGSTKLTTGQAHRRLGSPQVFVRSRLRRARLVEAEVRRLAQRILTQVSRGQAPSLARIAHGSERRREPVPCELSLDLVGDRRMRRLNREYRGRDHPTDVLAFPMRAATTPVTRHRGPVAVQEQRVPRVTPDMLGDVVISVPTAARQAAAVGHSVEHELAALLVHGVLHLCGYDHERGARAALRMRRKERSILRALGPLPKLLKSR